MANEITIKDGITPGMQEMARQFPVEMPKAMISLGQWLRKKIASEARAGHPAESTFSPLNSLTVMLRRASGVVTATRRRKPSKAVIAQSILSRIDPNQVAEGFGGRLTGQINPYGLLAFKSGKLGSEYFTSVGFMDEFFPGSVAAAERFQKAQPEKRMGKPSRILLRLRLGKAFKQPLTWPAKPERNIFEPYMKDPATEQEKFRVLAEAVSRIRLSAMAKSQAAIA